MATHTITISEADALQIVNRFILYGSAPITIHANSNYIIDSDCLEWLRMHTTLESIIIDAEYLTITTLVYTTGKINSFNEEKKNSQ